MGREQSRQSCLATEAIAANTFSAANALVANIFAAAAAAFAVAPTAAASAASTATAATVIPFPHCVNKYSPWDFNPQHGRCIASLLPEEKASHSHEQQ